MRNKILITIVCLLLVVCLAVSLASCNKNKTEDKKITSIVFLGDSICEGVAGPAPLQERVNYSYYGILGQINGIEAHNRSVSGYHTKHLLDYISRDDKNYEPVLPNQPEVNEETASLTQTLIRTSDVIHISILGNDLLQFDFPIMILELAAKQKYNGSDAYLSDPAVVAVYQQTRFQSESYTIIPPLQDDVRFAQGPCPGYGMALYEYAVSNARIQIGKIVDRLKKLNPNALIIFQNVYNPIDEHAELVSTELKLYLTMLGNGEENSFNFDSLDPAVVSASYAKLRAVAGDMIYGLDSVLNDYTDKITIADAYHTFDAIYQANHEIGEDLIYVDGVHPSDFGHAVLAQMNQELLVSKGLLKMDGAVDGYKKLRNSQLDRMYTGATKDSTTFDVAAAKADIESKSNMQDITLSYFNAIKGYTPKLFDSVLTGKTNGVAYTQNKTYNLSTLYMYTPLARGWKDTAFEMLIEGPMNLADTLASLGATATITFKTDNTWEINVDVNVQYVLEHINDILSMLSMDIDEVLASMNNMDLSGSVMSEDLDIVDFVLIYANNMFAGFDQNNFYDSLDLLKNSMGISLSLEDKNGDAITKASVNSLIAEILQSNPHKLPSNMSDKIKNLGNVSIKVEGVYSLKDCTSYTGKTYEGIYFGQYYDNISPFLIGTKFKDADNVEHVRFQIEILGMLMIF